MGDNRILSPYNYNKVDSRLFRGFHLRDPQKRWKGSGIAIPVFSLRSENSFGIGEFTDLKLMIDWAEKTGMDIIQMLPINDTTMNHTWQDSYPYNANSIFALHPAYINLEKVGKIADTLKFNKEKSKLNALEEIDYEAVTEAKWSYLREIYNNEGESTFKTKSFKDYFEKNQIGRAHV